MMGRWAFSVAAAAAILVCGSPSSAQGLISRRYALDSQQSDDFYRIVENAVPSSSNLNWPDLRRRIYKSSGPAANLRITDVAGRIAISDDTPRPIIDVIAGGEAMKWKINDGQILDVSAKTNDEGVFITVLGSDYQRITVYRNVGRQLVAESTITSPGLSAPIRYKFVYN